MLEYVHENLWLVRQPLKMLGLDFGTVMTIIRLEDYSLLIHSPIELNSHLLREIEALGNVKYVISPNTFHHVYGPRFMEHFPNATYYYAPGLEKKIKNKLPYIKNKQELKQGGIIPWSRDISHLHITGMPFVNEFVFYHKISKTLITSNLVYVLEQGNTLWNKFLLLAMGGKAGVPSQSRLFKCCIRNKKDYNNSISMLNNWDITRMIMSHGTLWECPGKDLLPCLLAT